MKLFNFFTLVIFSIALSFYAAGQSIDPFPIDSTGITLQSIMDQVYQNLDSTDTAEGKSYSKVRRIESYWTPRVTANPNDTSKPDMFQSYYHSLQQSVIARQAASVTCNSNGFHGKWECIGPDSIDGQYMGYVTCVWADPADSNYILAGTYGGLFKTVDGGANWECITNNAPIAYGAHHISSITVNPLNKNTIYLGTASDFGLYSYSILKPHYNWGALGSAMLKSYDGGQNWEIETLSVHGNFRDSTAMIQQVKFTPDSTRLYVLCGNEVFTRVNAPGNSWVDITPLEVKQYKSKFTDFEFDPGNQSHFFIANGFLTDEDPKASIWESTVAVPADTQWTKITSGFSDTLLNFSIFPSLITPVPFNDTELIKIDISIPDDDTLYAFIMSNARIGNISPYMGLYKFNMTGSPRVWTRVNNQIPYVQNPNYTLLQLEVSNANTSANGGRRNIYIGVDVPFQSFDGGATFRQIGTYVTPTHADIRDIFIQAATNTERGIGDRILFANDGGVSFRYSGYDTSGIGTAALHSTTNINGKGLTCGHIWSIATSEHRGIAFTGAMHNGLYSYEPTQSPKWVLHRFADAYSTYFDKNDRTTAYGIFGFTTISKDSSISGPNRLIDTLRTNNDNYPGTTALRGRSLNPTFKVDDSNYHYVGVKGLYIERISNSLWSGLNPNNSLPTGINSEIHDLDIAPQADSFTGYVLFGHRREVYYRDNTGLGNGDFISTLNDVPGTNPLSCIITDPKNPNRVWVGMGNFIDNPSTPTEDRVYYSPDWGATWIDVSKGLPSRIIVSEIIYYEGQNMLFCATDVGIYKCDFSTFNSGATTNGYNNSVEWECFNDGASGEPDFPNVYVTQLAINNCEGKLYASTYGRSIWATDLSENSFSATPTEVITTNTTISSDRYINTGILVKSGNTLLINNTGGVTTNIFMPKNGRIVVEKGAKLIVDGARITNGCEGCMWEGIRLEGDITSSQLAANQGSVELKDATIEHAKIGVANYGPGDYVSGILNTGGIIKAENTIFLNNARAVELEEYRYKTSYGVLLRNYKAEFTKCIFEINDDYKGDTTNKFYSHVSVRGVNGVRFFGCDFYNRYTGDEYDGAGDGIRGTNSGILVRAYCDPNVSPCIYDRSQFIGLRNGIWLHKEVFSTNTSLIDRSDFDSCGVGIYLSAEWRTRITRNFFSIGNGHNVHLDPVWDCYKNIGIWTNHTRTPLIEDNEFEGVSHGAQHADHQNYGTLIDNSCTDVVENTNIYHNDFHDLDRACVARGVNSDSWRFTNSQTKGVRYYCNSYEDNTTDILIASHDDNPVTMEQSIADYQGSMTEAAGNLFLSGGTNHFLNVFLNPNPQNHYYHHFNNSNDPNINSSYPFVKSSTINANSCTSNYPESGGIREVPLSSGALTNAKNNFFVFRDSFNVKRDSLDDLIDGGDTEGLLSDISSWTETDSTTAKSTLLGISPYVSMEAATAIGNANILFQSSLIEILEANPELLKEEVFLEYLQYTMPNPLNGTQIGDLRTVAETGSERAVLESKIEMYDAKMTEYGSLVMHHYLLDTSASDIDSIPAWLDTLNTVSAAYAKVGHYADLAEYTTAESILDDIPNEFSLSTEESEYHTLFTQLWDFMQQLRDSGRTIYNMTGAERDALDAIGEDDNAVGRLVGTQVGTITSQIDQMYGQPCDFEPEHLPAPKPGREEENIVNEHQYKRSLQEFNSKGDYIKAYPNPASEQVTFEYEYKNAMNELTLKVTNTTGQVIKTIQLKSYRGKAQWITESVPSGIYIYELKDGELSIDIGRIVVTK